MLHTFATKTCIASLRIEQKTCPFLPTFRPQPIRIIRCRAWFLIVMVVDCIGVMVAAIDEFARRLRDIGHRFRACRLLQLRLRLCLAAHKFLLLLLLKSS